MNGIRSECAGMQCMLSERKAHEGGQAEEELRDDEGDTNFKTARL